MSDETVQPWDSDHTATPTITQLAGDIYRLDGAEVYVIPSRSRPGVDHLVIRHPDFGWDCSCEATITACWHVKEIRKALGES